MVEQIIRNISYERVDYLLLSSILEIVALFMFLILIISLYNFSKKYLEIKLVSVNRQSELQELDLKCKYNYKVEEIDEELDIFISKIFAEYILIHDFKLVGGLVNELEEIELYNNITDQVLSTISESFMTRILLIYNKNEIHNVILNKVIVNIVRYCEVANGQK